jgi:hypothetical protein
MFFRSLVLTVTGFPIVNVPVLSKTMQSTYDRHKIKALMLADNSKHPQKHTINDYIFRPFVRSLGLAHP